jgi:hypothetical protein
VQRLLANRAFPAATDRGTPFGVLKHPYPILGPDDPGTIGICRGHIGRRSGLVRQKASRFSGVGVIVTL